jgi:uncharacterized membrane protein YfcA
LETLALYLLLGAFAGTVAGLLGVGGGLLIVPVLVFIFQYQGIDPAIQMQLAIGTSLATIVITSMSSIRAHHAHGAVIWPVVIRLVPGIVIGTLSGALIADAIPSDKLKTGFGVFVLLVAVQMIFDIKPKAQRHLPAYLGMTFAGYGIGIISALVGIGGGTVTTPFLLWCNTAIRNAIATSAACGFPIAVAGVIGYLLTGLNETFLPEWASGYIYWPAVLGITITSALFAPIGARLTHTLPVSVVKKIFALLLAVLAVRLLLL